MLKKAENQDFPVFDRQTAVLVARLLQVIKILSHWFCPSPLEFFESLFSFFSLFSLFSLFSVWGPKSQISTLTLPKRLKKAEKMLKMRKRPKRLKTLDPKVEHIRKGLKKAEKPPKTVPRRALAFFNDFQARIQVGHHLYTF